jgi:hypothetical protein
MSNNSNGKSAIQDLASWVRNYAAGGEVTKQAAADSASSHASASVDDGTKPASTGARSSENSADVSKQQPAQTPESATASDANCHPSGGRVKHGNEPDANYCDEGKVPPVKDKKDVPDADTAGPKDHEKTSAATLLTDARSILAKVASLVTAAAPAPVAPAAPAATVEKKAEAACSSATPGTTASMCDEKAPEVTVDKGEKKDVKPEDETAKQAALDAARVAGATTARAIAERLGLVKEASAAPQPAVSQPANTEAYINSIIKEAQLHADRVYTYLSGFAKQAAGEMDAMMAAGGGGMPPEAGGMPPGAGGIPGAPAGVEGEAGLPPGAGAPGAEGQVSDEDLMMLAQVLEEMGITPEELLAELSGQGGGGMPPEAGGMPPEAGGMPPGAGAPPPPEAGGMPPGAGAPPPPEKSAEKKDSAPAEKKDEKKESSDDKKDSEKEAALMQKKAAIVRKLKTQIDKAATAYGIK